jgi:hypothetical protein
MQARIEQDAQELSYRAYVTDSLQAAAQGNYITARWADLIERKQDTRTADEIVLDIMSRAGLKPKGGEEK